MKQLFFISILALFLSRCDEPREGNDIDRVALNKQLPRVLIITTGISNENAQLTQGVVVAIQSFNKKGAIVRLEPRDILYHFDELASYNIIILSTFPGYHDADRQYSLSYMSDEELHNLTRFVQQGGVMISGDNVGRNFQDGTDRIIEYQQLNQENWELSKCYGLSLSEKNMTAYYNEGELGNSSKWKINTRDLLEKDAELWTLVPDSITSEKLKVFSYWKNGTDSIPSFISNTYEKGTAYLMSSSSFLHPVNDGGYWSIDQIEAFYNYVIDEYHKSNNLNVYLNPWPDAYDYAFCVTLNSEGTPEQYKRIFKVLDAENIKPTIFVNGLVNDTIKSFLKTTDFPLASSGYAYRNFQGLKYPQSLDDILLNENNWAINFKGFRFPYTKPGYWGLVVLSKNDYVFESSIGANNLDFIHGSVFPYNVVITNEMFYESTDILEIAPTYHDDYYFLKSLHVDKKINPNLLQKDVMIYTKYLESFWDRAVKPYNGLMVYLGHPKFVGYSDTTLISLENLIKKVKQDNTWITSIDDVANFRKNLGLLHFYIDNDNEEQLIKVVGPSAIIVENVCLNFTGKIKSAKAKKGQVKLIENPDGFKLVFDASDGQTITVW